MGKTGKPVSTKSKIFLETLSQWFNEKGELLILIWYPHGAGYHLELHQDLDLLEKRIAGLESGYIVSLIKDFYLPIRGIVDQELITRALQYIEENEESLILRLDYEDANKGTKPDFTRGENHTELLENLNDWLGKEVALGKDKNATWAEDHIEEFEAYAT